MEAIGKLARLDRRLALLGLLTARGIKPVSKLEGFEGPDDAVAKLLKELGLEVEVSKSGCKTDILFGKKGAMTRYREAEKLRGKEKLRALGLVFGYPECCARFFSKFMTGETEGKPGKTPPLEHFICPGCKKSPALLKEYREVEKELFSRKRDSDKVS